MESSPREREIETKEAFPGARVVFVEQRTTGGEEEKETELFVGLYERPRVGAA